MTRGRGEQVRTEEKRAEEAETKNLELEVIGPFSVLGPFFHSCSTRPPSTPMFFDAFSLLNDLWFFLIIKL